MKEPPVKTGSTIKHPGRQQTPEIKTDGPLSEKDEVKKAEERTRRSVKEHR